LKVGSGIRSIARNGVFLMGSTWIETVLHGLYVVAIAHFLGPELYGAWAYATAAYVFVLMLTQFGFDMLLPIRLGADRGNSAGFVGVTLALRLVLLGLAAIGLVIYALLAEPAGTTRLALLLIIPALCGRGLALWSRIVFVGHERVGDYMKMAVVVRVVEVACGVVLLAAGGGLFAIIVLHSLAWLVEAAIGFRLVRGKLAPYRPRFDMGEATDQLRQGAVLGLAMSLTGWLMAGPVILLRHIVGDLESLGQFSLALQVAMIVVATAQSFLVAALPVLSRSVAREEPLLRRYGMITGSVALAGFGGAAAVGYLFGPGLVTWVFGPEFDRAGDLLGPCLLMGGLIVAPMGYAQLLVLRGRRWPGVFASGIGGIVLFLTLPPAVDNWGIYGAVIAAGVAWLARAIILVISAALWQEALGTRPAE
jgi:O-antigen/teichoic acid export membrane protein